MTAALLPAAPAANPAVSGLGARLPLALRLAWRDLRGGLGGYWIFLLCIALGVAAIAGVGSLAGSLADGLAREGRVILGGDAAVSTVSEPLSPAELHFFALRGALSSVVTTRAMARRADGDAALVDLKAVDAAYPTAGAVALDPPQPLQDALALHQGLYGIVADPTLVARLALQRGDEVTIGTASFALRAILRSEPDTLAGGIAFAPRVMMSEAGLRAAGLIEPGSLARFTTRITLAGGAGGRDAVLNRFVEDAKASFPDAGWEVKTRLAVSPEFDRNLGRFTQFLTLIGLTALVVGGVGVANAVEAAMARKRESLAVLKAIGASGAMVFRIGLAQVTLVALFGIAAGLVLGAALPFLAAATLKPLIPIPLMPSLHVGALALGALYGFLTALVFSLPALGRSHDVPVSALFRAHVEPGQAKLRLKYRLALGLAALALGGAAIVFASDHQLAAWSVLATIGAFLALRLVAYGFALLARRLAGRLGRLGRSGTRPGVIELRLALGNLHRPGALTAPVVLSLGLGLTLLVALTLVDRNIQDQVDAVRPGVTPSFFFIDIPSGKAAAFDGFIREHAPEAKIERVPMMRGRILALNGVPADTIKAKADDAWVLEGDRGITYADQVPAGSRVAAGQWWPKDYAGPPLVSFDQELAEGLGLRIGDSVAVNVLGRPITATIANLRRIDWQSLGINFVMVFSPNTFAGAPHMDLATAAFRQADAATAEAALARDVATRYPTVTVVRVKDVLDAIKGLVGKLGLATRGASGITITASLLVLGGALAAGRRARIYDAVMLKVLGATRRRLLVAFLIEYAILGCGTALFAIAAGSAAAAAVVEHVMHFDFHFAAAPAFEAIAVSLLVTVGLGLVGTWRILGQSPAATLREA